MQSPWIKIDNFIIEIYFKTLQVTLLKIGKNNYKQKEFRQRGREVEEWESVWERERRERGVYVEMKFSHVDGRCEKITETIF